MEAVKKVTKNAVETFFNSIKSMLADVSKSASDTYLTAVAGVVNSENEKEDTIDGNASNDSDSKGQYQFKQTSSATKVLI